MPKQLFDFLLSILAVFLLLPIMALIAVMVRITMGNPVIFCQQRPGLNGKAFKVYKFRTMSEKTDSKGNLLKDSARLTSFGRFLRSTSLDELPELFNVLKGDMSLVGPRPLLMEYLDRYTPEQARRHEARPGITGWAQVNGRNALSWEEKFKLDIWYVDNHSLWLDIRILFRTLWKTLKCDNINHANHTTMEKFKGHDKNA